MRAFRSKWSLQTLLVAGGLSFGLAHAQSLELQTQVEALVESGPSEVQGARIAHPKLIHAFYAQRGFRPAWTSRTASDLRRAVTDSEADGLDPRDYHQTVLDRLGEPPVAGDATGSFELAAYEIVYTDALLRLADHLSFGKVAPGSFDAHWNYGRTLEGVDVAQKIEAALASGDLYAEIDKLKPTHRMYVTLKQELARFRLAAARPERVTIGAGESIAPDAHDARVPSVRSRLAQSGDLAAADVTDSDLYDATLQAAVRNFQERMGLTADGAIDARTITELNVRPEERIGQLRVNLDRGRVLLQNLPSEFVVVNIAAYWVYYVRGQEIVWNARAQVGKTYRRTPIFRSDIDYLVFNPTWTVPPGIIRNDILPAARKDPESITRRGLRVLDANGNVVDPKSVNWSKFKSGNIPYTLRQEPGPRNALGRVKFMFPNSYSVYLHDTPSISLFDADDRALSSGCVRVERPLELAALLLAGAPEWDAAKIAETLEAGQTQNVTLPGTVPVLLAYWTAWVDAQGRVNFRRDVYGQDAQWAAGLEREYAARL